MISGVSMVGCNSVPLKVADVVSVADEERRNKSLRISVSSIGEPVLKSKRNPHKLDLGAGIHFVVIVRQLWVHSYFFAG